MKSPVKISSRSADAKMWLHNGYVLATTASVIQPNVGGHTYAEGMQSILPTSNLYTVQYLMACTYENNISVKIHIERAN